MRLRFRDSWVWRSVRRWSWRRLGELGTFVLLRCPWVIATPNVSRAGDALPTSELIDQATLHVGIGLIFPPADKGSKGSAGRSFFCFRFLTSLSIESRF